MTNALAERLAKLDKAQVQKLSAALDQMEKGGEAVYNPGSHIGTAGSHARKAFGAEAFEPGAGNAQGNFSFWEPWQDPSRQMDPDIRNAMLAKSLADIGYKPQNRVFKSHGDYLRQGFLKSKDPDFARAHAGYFEGIRPEFWKARGITSVSGESGGYLLMPEFAPKIEQLLYPNDVVSRIDMLNMSGSKLHIPRARDTNRADGTRNGGAVGYWLDVGQTIPESNFKFGMTKLDMKKLVVIVFFPPELLTDSEYALEEYMRKSIREEINWQLGRTTFWGQDGAEPLGFMRSGCKLTVAKESGQSNYTIQTANVTKMHSRLFSNAGSRPVWLAHKSTAPQLAALDVGSNPVALNVTAGGITAAPTQLLRGMEIVESEFCAQLGSAGDIIGADLKGYKGIMRSLVREDVSMEYAFLSDLNALRVVVGFDGRTLYNEVVQPFQAPGSDTPDTQSWIVELAARKP